MDKIEYKVLTDKLNVPVGSKMIGHPAGHLLENDANGEILTITDIERNPDWFEQMEEKDYEIIAFKNTANDIIFEKCNNGSFTSCGSEFGLGNTEHFLSKTRHKIYSVKRLSDGEVFTVGDKVKHWTSSLRQYNKWSINTFILRNNILLAYSGTGFSINLGDLIKRKQPLFTTEDGVDIYEGDEFIVVNKEKMEIQGKLNALVVSGQNYNSLYFSTEERAQEYVNNYKSQYSKADIGNAWYHTIATHPVDPDIMDEFLKNLYND